MQKASPARHAPSKLAMPPSQGDPLQQYNQLRNGSGDCSINPTLRKELPTEKHRLELP